MQELRTARQRTETPIDFETCHHQAQALRAEAFANVVRRCGHAMARASRAPLRFLHIV